MIPKVSVVVPNYNHARFLPKRIESILRQTFQDFELILLDDCSTDGSRSILSRYSGDSRVRIELNQANCGSPFKQWNKGLRLARGEYVWIAESDDYADERLLERLAPRLESDPRVAFAYCRSWCVSDDVLLDRFADSYLGFADRHRWTSDFLVDGREECRNYFVFTNPVPNASAVVFRKAVYESVGGADEGYRLCGDWKLWASMALTGRIAHVGEPLNYYRFHTATVRTTSIRGAQDVREHLQVIHWILDRVTPTDDELERICEKQAGSWVPAMMSLHVPIGRKRAILRDVRAIDPHPVRSALLPALLTVRQKLMRHWRDLRTKLSPAS